LFVGECEHLHYIGSRKGFGIASSVLTKFPGSAGFRQPEHRTLAPWSFAMSETFISEPIAPERGTFAPGSLSTGLASIPTAFVWRNRRYEIHECLNHAKLSSPEGGRAGAEVYLRRQEFLVRLHTGQIARLYVERHSRGRGPRVKPDGTPASIPQRWFIFSITTPDNEFKP
jgi:hypothetical protein